MFYEKLRRKHFWRVKRNARKPRVPKDLLINNRPIAINQRLEFGHWEGDLMMFKQEVVQKLSRVNDVLDTRFCKNAFISDNLSYQRKFSKI